jgi:hypothetical protein
VDAIPYDLGPGRGGAPKPSSRKDANISGLSDGRSAAGLAREFSKVVSGSPSGRIRLAMKVSLGALDARPAQGRVGEISRHIAQPLVSHPLLLAEASDRLDPPRLSRAFQARAKASPGGPRRLVSRTRVRTKLSPSRTRLGTIPGGMRLGELARFASRHAPALRRGTCRWKGVQTA